MAEFIMTEALGGAGEGGELAVFEALKAAYAGRDGLGYWKYPLKDKTTQREADILFAEPELGLVVIEVKSLPLDMIAAVTGHTWHLSRPYYGQMTLNPYLQANRQTTLIGETAISKTKIQHLTTRAVVALPLITREEWDARFNHLLSDVPMLFADQMSPAKFRKALETTSPIHYGQPLHEAEWQLLCHSLGTSGSIPKRQVQLPPVPAPTPAVRKIDLIDKTTKHLHAFDLQQELIAKTIPPGPQRIRGIAGSGKTVLLAQKAANMHLRHPDWHIALVFFSRSLYDQIRFQVDHWLREGSNGEITLQDAQHKLRILHAWGADGQPGFYRTLAQHTGVKPLNVKNTPAGTPTQKLLFSCKALLDDAKATGRSLQIFDAVLIDEGQDLVHEQAQLSFKEKQAFYWMGPISRCGL